MRTDDDWQLLNDLFQQAIEGPPQDRAGFVQQACARDSRLGRRLGKLLAAHERAETFLEEPAVSAVYPSEPLDPAPLIGRTIGRYRIRGLIARGGMGTVYEAIQDQPRRSVALKFLRYGLSSPSLLKRFEVEAQALGRLQHPGIAQVFEAGMADTGHGAQPFFAMELIDGQDLLAYASGQRLGTRERLELMARICEAVHHAHQKGIVHRDLKPANILVDQSGQPKILDFGVARLTDGDIQVTTVQTDVGQLIGTLPYMSPEQVTGDPAELDIRSDVYSLGVLCYELLAGRLPYDLSNKALPEVARVIRETAPLRLSAVNRSYRGDVVTIVSKALEKDKSRRYQSAQALADDLRCYLRGQPITARSASGWYVLRKAIYRRRRTLGAIAMVLVIAAGATVYALIQSRRQALADHRRVAALTPYLRAENLIARRRGMEPQLWSALAAEVDALLSDSIAIDPEFAAAYYQRGQIRLQLQDWSNHPQDRRLFEQAIEDFEQADRVAGDHGFPPALWAAGGALVERHTHLGWRPRYLRSHDGVPEDDKLRAREYYRRATLLDDDNLHVKLSRAILGPSFGKRGKPELRQARALLEQVLADPVGRHLAEAHLMMALLCAGAYDMYWAGMEDQIILHHDPLYDYECTERHLARALALDDTNDKTWWAAAVMARRDGRFNEAQHCMEQALSIKPRSVAWNRSLGYLHAAAGRFALAVPIFERLTEWYPQDSRCWNLLARARHWIQDYPGVEQNARRAIELNRHNEFAWSNLILSLWKQQRHADAEQEFRAAVHISPANFGAWMNRAEGLYGAGRPAESLQVYEHICRLHEQSAVAWINRARVLKSLGRAGEAFECLQRVRDCYFDNALPWADLACEYLAGEPPAHRDLQAGVQVAALASIPRYCPSWAHAVLALADLRAENFEQARARAGDIQSTDAAGAWARLVEAAAHQALRHEPEALRSFERAEQALTQAPVDDARLISFYKEVAATLDRDPKPLQSVRPQLYEVPY